MSCKCDFVGEDVVVANHAVVRDVNSDHEEVAGPDPSLFAFAVCAMQRAKLANDIVVADLEKTPLAAKLQILWLTTKDRMFEDAIARADLRESFDDRVGANLAVGTDFNVVFNYGCGMNNHRRGGEAPLMIAGHGRSYERFRDFVVFFGLPGMVGWR